MMCKDVVNQYQSKIEEIVKIQVEENREAIFFVFDDGSTSDIIKGGPTNISIRREQEKAILSQGNIIASVHTHPDQLDPSTIDIMTGSATNQNTLCVAMPTNREDINDFVLTCLDLSDLNVIQRRRLVRAMRRSSLGITEIGRQSRKQFNVQRFNVTGCRLHSIDSEDVDGFIAP